MRSDSCIVLLIWLVLLNIPMLFPWFMIDPIYGEFLQIC